MEFDLYSANSYSQVLISCINKNYNFYEIKRRKNQKMHAVIHFHTSGFLCSLQMYPKTEMGKLWFYLHCMGSALVPYSEGWTEIENKLFKIIFGLKKFMLKGKWSKLHNAELQSLYFYLVLVWGSLNQGSDQWDL